MQLWNLSSARMKPRGSSDPYYDLLEDFNLVVASFQTQYGIRLSRDLKDMKWNEFCMLLSGIQPETPLGRIVSIRAEDDKEVLKHFSKEQKRIRSEWRNKRAKMVPVNDRDTFLEQMKQAFIKMAGGAEQ